MADTGFGGVFSGEFENFPHVLLSSKLREGTWGKGINQSRNNKDLPPPQPCTMSTSKIKNVPLLVSEQIQEELGGLGRSHTWAVRSCLQVFVQRQNFHRKLHISRYSLIIHCTSAHQAQHCLHGKLSPCLSRTRSHHQSWKVTAGVVSPALRGFSLCLHMVLYLCPEIQW